MKELLNIQQHRETNSMHPHSMSRVLQHYQKNSKGQYDLGHRDLEHFNATNKQPSMIDHR
jgi:hypothetical protein